MAKLNVSLTLTSTDILPGELSFTETDEITVTGVTSGFGTTDAPVSGGSITHINSVSFAGTNKKAYIYLKHTGLKGDGTTTSTDNLNVYDDDDKAIAILAPGEFLFLPVQDNNDVAVRSASGSNTIQVEFFFVEAD
tara:strand:+ start:3017 stop:3424 length:408 start_codon:yes stop_codon:yes gene_type:complete